MLIAIIFGKASRKWHSNQQKKLCVLYGGVFCNTSTNFHVLKLFAFRMILHTFQQLTLIVEYEFKMTSNYRFTPTGGRKEKEKKKECWKGWDVSLAWKLPSIIAKIWSALDEKKKKKTFETWNKFLWSGCKWYALKMLQFMGGKEEPL